MRVTGVHSQMRREVRASYVLASQIGLTVQFAGIIDAHDSGYVATAEEGEHSRLPECSLRSAIGRNLNCLNTVSKVKSRLVYNPGGSTPQLLKEFLVAKLAREWSIELHIRGEPG